MHSRFMPKADYGADILLAVLDKRQNGHHGYSREKSAFRHFCQRLKALRGHAHIWLKLFAKLILHIMGECSFTERKISISRVISALFESTAQPKP